MSKPQQTIKKAVSYQGIGLHSGEPVHMVFKPAPEDTGIVFVRTDIEGHPSVRAHIDNVTNTMRATTLENGEAKVFTVEHVMAAFSAMNIVIALKSSHELNSRLARSIMEEIRETQP